mgnify:FL=1
MPFEQCMDCMKCFSPIKSGDAFNHVAAPPSHSENGDGRFVTDKPTSDPRYQGQRFMSSNISGEKRTVIYRSDGSIIDG